MLITRQECSLLIAAIKAIYPETVTKKFVAAIGGLPSWQWNLVVEFHSQLLAHDATGIPKLTTVKLSAKELLNQLRGMDRENIDMFILQSLQYPSAFEFYVSKVRHRSKHNFSNSRLAMASEQKKVVRLPVSSLDAFLKVGLDPSIIAEDGCNLLMRFFVIASIDKLTLALSAVKDSNILNLRYKSDIPLIQLYSMTDQEGGLSDTQLGCIKLVLDKGADINATTTQGLTLFQHAVMNKDFNLVKLLVGYPDLNMPRIPVEGENLNGINPALVVMSAYFEDALLSKIPVIERLFRLGCDVNETFSDIQICRVTENRSIEQTIFPAQPKANFFTLIALKILEGKELREEDRLFTRMLGKAGFDFDAHYVSDFLGEYSVGSILQNSQDAEFRRIYARYRRAKARENVVTSYSTTSTSSTSDVMKNKNVLFQLPPIQSSSTMVKDDKKAKTQIIENFQSIIIHITDQMAQGSFTGNSPNWIQTLQNKTVEDLLKHSIDDLKEIEKNVCAWSEKTYRRLERWRDQQANSDEELSDELPASQSPVELNAIYEGVLPIQEAPLTKIRHTMNTYLLLPRTQDGAVDFTNIEGFSAVNDVALQGFRHELTAPKLTIHGAGIKRLKGKPLECKVHIGDSTDTRMIEFELKITETTDRIGLIRLNSTGTGPAVYALGPVICHGLHDNRYNNTTFQCAIALRPATAVNRLEVSV